MDSDSPLSPVDDLLLGVKWLLIQFSSRAGIRYPDYPASAFA